MSSVTVVATVEASNVPQRVRLDVTDTGTPAIFSSTVVRNDPDGSQVPVRTVDGLPVVLSTSGSNRVGLVYDYEMPYGVGVTYSTIESPANVTGAVTVVETAAWLVHPGVPSLSIQVNLRAGSWEEETLAVQQGVFYPMGRKNAVVQSDGVRRGPQTTITVAAETAGEVAAMRSLLDDAGILLLNVPPSLGLGIDTCYIAIADVKVRRPSSVGSNPWRDFEMPFVVVDRPAGGTQSQRTYVDLLDFASYAEMQSAFSTYAQLLAGG